MAGNGSVVACVQDLFFAARVEAVLGRAGVRVQAVEADAAGVERLRSDPPAVLVLDLGVPEAVREELLSWAPGRCAVVAFGSHVERERLQAARDAGCRAVTTNGGLERDLARLVAPLLT